MSSYYNTIYFSLSLDLQVQLHYSRFVAFKGFKILNKNEHLPTAVYKSETAHKEGKCKIII